MSRRILSHSIAVGQRLVESLWVLIINTSGLRYVIFTLQPPPIDVIFKFQLTQTGKLKDTIDILLEKGILSTST